VRITGGICKGVRLKGLPRGKGFRPTSDFVREAIFNILGGRKRNEEVVDLFAGSGALGLEALSRGARSCVFVEKARVAINVIRQNIEKTGFKEKATIVKCDVMRSLGRLERLGKRFGLAFADAPYKESLEITEGSRFYRWLVEMGEEDLLKEGALLVLEHSRRSLFAEAIPGFVLEQRRGYGETSLTLLRRGK